jgi:hypothetical protein
MIPCLSSWASTARFTTDRPSARARGVPSVVPLQGGLRRRARPFSRQRDRHQGRASAQAEGQRSRAPARVPSTRRVLCETTQGPTLANASKRGWARRKSCCYPHSPSRHQVECKMHIPCTTHFIVARTTARTSTSGDQDGLGERKQDAPLGRRADYFLPPNQWRPAYYRQLSQPGSHLAHRSIAASRSGRRRVAPAGRERSWAGSPRGRAR